MTRVDLVTGFLGSGKTTFIIGYARYLVKKGLKVGIIENDFGSINIDRMLLEKEIGDICRIEMVIAGDADCHRRRLKTKLIAMGMDKYDIVIVEPSGVFDIDEFFDLLYDEPLERWYEIGNVLTVIDAGLETDLSNESRFILASEAARAGRFLISKTDIHPIENDRLFAYVNECLKEVNCERTIDSDTFILKWNDMTDDDYKVIESSGYRSYDFVKKFNLSESDFKSLFFFHVETDADSLEKTIREIYNDTSCGNVFRIKGFIPNMDGTWTEVNATKNNIEIKTSEKGQEVFIVIGENLSHDAVGKHWISYRNEYV